MSLARQASCASALWLQIFTTATSVGHVHVQMVPTPIPSRVAVFQVHASFVHALFWRSMLVALVCLCFESVSQACIQSILCSPLSVGDQARVTEGPLLAVCPFTYFKNVFVRLECSKRANYSFIKLCLELFMDG